MRFADFPKHLTPGFARIAVFFKIRERLVKRLPLGIRGDTISKQVSFVEFCEPGEEL